MILKDGMQRENIALFLGDFARTDEVEQIERHPSEFYLGGSRYFGRGTVDSDLDLYANDHHETLKLLSDMGFEQDGESYDPQNMKRVFSKITEAGLIHIISTPIVDKYLTIQGVLLRHRDLLKLLYETIFYSAGIQGKKDATTLAYNLAIAVIAEYESKTRVTPPEGVM